MSHVAKVDLVVTDLGCLKAACSRLGLEFVEGESKWKWYGRWMNDYSAGEAAYHHGISPKQYGKDAEHVIRVPGPTEAYEVGVYKNPKGKGWVLVYDNFCGGKGLEKIAGKNLVTLKEEYGADVTIKTMRRQGFAAKRTRLANGRLQVTLTR